MKLSSTTRSGLQIAGLWSLAVAQPLYAVLQRNPEFFVAYRAKLPELLALMAIISLAVPLALWALRWLAGRVWSPAGTVLQVTIVAVCAAAVASHALAVALPLPAALHVPAVILAGLTAAWAYVVFAGAQWCATALAVMVPVAPIVFLGSTSMRPFARPSDPTAEAAVPIKGQTPPIVLVIFDQLPLVSLMRDDGSIDADVYPAFGSLARDATWYRGASTVCELTGWAVPAIVTGLAPIPTRLPTAQHHPNNLFTYLGSAYHYEVVEPITHLCPDRLCPPEETSFMTQVGGMVADTSVIYLHAELPADLRKRLPTLTDNWKGFIAARNWQKRWIGESRNDRRQGPLEFIDGIDASDPQPTLYYLHALLPHEPYIYLRSGKQFAGADNFYGLNAYGRWVNDDWPVLQEYRRHLTQVRYVDSLLGRLLDRLKQQGLYDRSLIIVTGDHGVSFRPGRPFKGLDEETLVDIMSVPLFIKLPGQHGGRVDDRNAQSIDIVPTISDFLDADLSWEAAGHSLLGAESRQSTKTIYHSGATRQITIEAAKLAALRDAAVKRKTAIFGRPGPGSVTPHLEARQDLIGRRLSSLTVSDDTDVRVLLDDVERIRKFDPEDEIVPALLTGQAIDIEGHAANATLAVALNGTIATTTRTYQPVDGLRPGAWAAMVDPAALRPGRNDVEVLVVRDDSKGATFERAYATGRFPEQLDLASRGAADFYGVDQKGLLPREGDGPDAKRWSSGDVSIAVPIEPTARPHSLRVRIAAASLPDRPIRIDLSGCKVFEGRMTGLPWARTFPIGDCGTALGQPEVIIGIHSELAPLPGKSGQPVGLGITAVNLYSGTWPPKTAKPGEARAEVRLLPPTPTPFQRSDVVQVELTNTGDTAWPSADDGVAAGAGTDIVISWRGDRTTAEQRLPLAYTMHPGDQVREELPLVPPANVDGHAPWTVTISPVGRDGKAIPVEAPCVLHVVEDRAREKRATERETPRAARRDPSR
jgi:hypothetical protein